ncbi:MAG: hypothetical protein ABWY55_08845 [Microbacterium sp.]
MTNAFDLNGDGYSETLGEDLNGDGVIDAVMQDTNLDGYVDSYGWDTNYDGATDTVAVDANQDGYLESAGWDTNRDGVVDTVAADTNGDGALEIVQQPAAYDPYATSTIVGGSPNYDGVAGLMITLAGITGNVTWGTPDSDYDGYNDNDDWYPNDPNRR